MSSSTELGKLLDEFEYFFSVEQSNRQARLKQLEQRQLQIERAAAQLSEAELDHHREQMQSIQRQREQALVVASVSRADSVVPAASLQPQQDPAFLHEKVVQLARALAKVTRERDRLDMELVRSNRTIADLQRRGASQRQQTDDVNLASHAQMSVWQREVVSLRTALEKHVAADRKDRHAAQQDKETVLNEVVEELGQVMAQRDLAFVELEKLRRAQQYAANSNSGQPPSVELDGAEKQIAALQLQLAHARRDVTLQSVNLHIAQERYGSLRRDVEKVCQSIQTTSDHCSTAATVLQEQQSSLALRGTASLSAAQISEMLLFVSRSRSDLSSISEMLAEMRAADSGTGEDPPPRQLQLTAN